MCLLLYLRPLEVSYRHVAVITVTIVLQAPKTSILQPWAFRWAAILKPANLATSAVEEFARLLAPAYSLSKIPNVAVMLGSVSASTLAEQEQSTNGVAHSMWLAQCCAAVWAVRGTAV